MHSPRATHTMRRIFESINKLRVRSKLIQKNMIGKRRLAASALTLVLVMASVLTISSYYGKSASAASRSAAGFFSDSYAGMTRGVNFLMNKLFGKVGASTNAFATVTLTPTISGCYYSGGQSRATVSVEVSWTGLANGDDIDVTLLGALDGTGRTITQASGANPPVITPQVVAFEIPATFSGTLTATAPGATDSKPIVSSSSCTPLVCGANDLGGTVFNDYNADGVKDPGETNGASGVTITAFDKNGATYTTSSDNLGRYCLSIPVANYPVRVEYTNIPAEFSGGFTTRLGTGNGSTVQFASAPNQNLNLGVNNPVDYCQSNPKVLLPCFFFGNPLATPAGDAATEPSMVRFDYNNNGVEIGVEKFAIASETGPIWGLAYKKTTGHLFGAATIRRHSGLGPQGLGGLYVLNAQGPMGMGNVLDAWNVETQLGVNVQDPMAPFGGSTDPATSNSNRGLSADKDTPSRDAQAFSAVGKLGFGDIDISEDENTLFFVNQYDKKLYGVNIAGYNPSIPATRPTAANIIVNTTIPDPGCVNGEWRPFGMKYRRGIAYVGGVCNAITSGSLSDLRASVQAYNIAGNSWTQIFDFPMSYPKGSPDNPSTEKGWHAWSDSWATILNGQSTQIRYSVPIFADIEFDVDGTMVLGFNDRSGMQAGRNNYRPDTSSTTLYTGWVGGDTLRAFYSNGTYILENNAKAGGVIGYAQNNNEGPGFGEFYEDNWRAPNGHTETTVGGLAIRPGSGEVVVGSMDPHDSSIWAAGVRYLSNSSGLRTHALAVYSDSNDSGSNTLGKSTGVGDVELRCEQLNYLDLGNRVWMDANQNGIQDPGEMPIAGVTVHLYRQGGADGTPGNGDDNTPVATAVTASDGTYHFTSIDADDNGSPDSDSNLTDSVGLVGGVGLLPHTNYVIRFDRGADYQFGGPLYGKRIGSANAGGGSYGALADLRDSDATSNNTYGLPGGNFPEIVVQHLSDGSPSVGSGAYGEVDHTMDAGFYQTFDFGDAPDPTFPTLLASNGARHVIVDGVYLGAGVDAEADGQPSAGHNGDDNNGTPDDEDGVVLPTLIAGQNASIQVTASVTGRLNAWIDFNGDGDWNDAGEHVFTDTLLAAGVNNLTVSVPLSATQGNACTRFRFTTSSEMATSPTGEAADGEVEDYLASIIKNVSIGNQVFYDNNNNGVKDSGELGINGVTVELYNDTNMDNVPDTAFPLDVQTTATVSANAGMYLFTQQTKNTTTGATLASPVNLLPGKYIVCLPASNFTSPGVLTGLWSSGTTAGANGTTTETASPDPNTGGSANNPGVDNDDNGSLSGGRVCSKWIDVGTNEPLGENPYNNNDALVPDSLSNLTIDFGFYGLSVGNLLFKDSGAGANYNNGIKDADENGIAGITVKLYAENGTTLLATTLTDGNGKYLFPGLAAGKYYVEVDRTNPILAGCTSSKDPANAANPNAADNDDNGTFANVTATTVRSPQLMLMPGDSTATGESDQAQSSSSGFGNPAAKDNPNTPDANSDLKVDFGFVPIYSLGNRVWKDTDNSGTINGAEVGVQGVTLRLLTSPGLTQAVDINGTNVANQTTDANGYYRFDNIPRGDYVVEVVAANFTSPGMLTGCVSSPVDGGDPDNDVDSDDNGVGVTPNPTTGIRSMPVTIGEGNGTAEPTNDNDPATNPQTGEALNNQSNRTVDFGFSPVYSLGNRVWKDVDNSGTINNGETGTNGVVVRLLTSPGLVQATDANGVLVPDQTTSGGGYYRFDNLLQGDYVIEVRASNFTGAGVLVGCVSSGPDAGDPDVDVDDSDDNGIGTNPNATTGVRSAPVTLGPAIGSEPTGDNDPATNPVSGEAADNNSNRTVDFGFVHVYSLGNRVWKDMDNSGTINAADGASPGINGVVVRLLSSPALTQARDVTGNLVPDQTTTGGGYYRFDNILAGDYVVEIVSSNFSAPGVLVGCSTSTGTSGIVGSTGPNEPAPDADTNTTDSDDNGEQAGAVVRSKPVTLGDGNGSAEPTNDNDPSTNPLPGEAENNQSNRTVDFGFTPIMNLGNLVWKDYDNDGIRDTSNPNEPGVSGVKVVLYADSDNSGTFNPPTDVMLAMTTTASDGTYGFNTVLPGTYFVVVDSSNFTGSGMLVGCLSSTGNDNGDTTDNNDNGIDNPNPPNGGVRSVPIVLIGGTEPTNDGDGANGNQTIDFSFIPTNMVIGNLIWKDVNNNGARDNGEMGVAGVKVNLYRDVDRNGTFNPPTDTLVAMKTTGADGTYQFTGLIPDPYFVQVDASNFNPGGPLYGCASSYGSVGGDSDQNERDHGSDSTGPALHPPISSVVHIVAFNEPPNPADGDDTNGNLTIDFGFATLMEVAIGGADGCIGPGDTLQVTATIRNTGQTPQGDNPNPEYSAALPSQLVGIPATCMVTGGTTNSCTVTATTVTWNGTIPAGQSVVIKFSAQVGNAVSIGTQFCVTSTVNFDSDNNGSNETSYTSDSCQTVTCPPVGPGFIPPNGSGCSILVYPVYTSNPANPSGQNTRINLTNINPAKPAAVHLFFVDGATCSIADSYVCLTANQTTSFLASDMDPGITGYMVAVAVDDKGCPVNFNFLIGDEYVKFDSGHHGNLTADCIPALPGGLPPCDGASVTATLNFDGVSYGRLPMTVAVDNVPSRAEGNDTLLILNRLSGNLGNGMDRLNPIFGILYDDVENALSFTLNPGTCQLRGSLNNGFPRTVPRFELAIPAGRSGWMRLYSTNAPVNGATINNNPNATSGSAAFNGAHSLHTLTLAPTATMTMPIFPPSCL